MHVIIYKPTKSAMQSGRGSTHCWLMVSELGRGLVPDDLMGWAGAGSTNQQIKLNFLSSNEAVAYAKRNGYTYDLQAETVRHVRPKAYADNFGYNRLQPWTH